MYTGADVHPCRVCCKVYHELCLKKKGKLYDPREQEAFKKAKTEKGWSCHDCVSLCQCVQLCINNNNNNNNNNSNNL